MENDDENDYIPMNEVKNDNCFFEIPMETALSILRDLEIPEDSIMEVYTKIISKKEYDNLY